MLIYLQTIETEEDKSKFEDIYREYRGLMYYVAYKRLHHEQDAEDAVHYTDAIRIRATKIGSFQKKYACTQRKSRRPRCGPRLSASEQLGYFAKKYV